MTLRRALLPLVSLTLALAPLACGDGQSPSSGLTSYMLATAKGAQFVPGELTTDPEADKPTVETIRSGNQQVFPGAQGRTAGGTVSNTSTAVLIGLEGDNAHWLVPVGVREAEPPFNLNFSSTLSFSPGLPTGKRALIFRAIDAAGQVGPAQTLTLDVADTVITGNLVIELLWDTEADLDLHVRIPNPNAKPEDLVQTYDVWARAPRALPPPKSGESYTQAQLDAGGRLMYDSNAQCVIDGQKHEEIVFPGAFPAGPYEVRVDTASLCGEPTARWYVEARDSAGDTIIFARGQSIDRDTFATHGPDSGVLAFTFSP